MNRILKKMFIAFSAISCCFSAHVIQTRINERNAVANPLEKLKENATQIDLRKPIIEAYYNKLDTDVKTTLSIENFEKGYMNNSYSLDEYLDLLNGKTETKGVMIPVHVDDGGSGGPVQSSSNLTMPLPFKGMDDADFMISDNHYRSSGYYSSSNRPLPTYTSNDKSSSYDKTHSREFYFSAGHNPRTPNYANDDITQVYWSFLDVGDIVLDTISFMSYDPFNFVQHAGMIVNKNKQWTLNGTLQSTTFIETIEAYASGVRFGFLDADRIVRNGTVILRSNTPYVSKIDDAVEFMFSQIGKEYYIPMDNVSEFLTFKTVPGREKQKWYCTELVFAAYYNAGLNICSTNASDSYPGKNGQYQFVIGSQFLDSSALKNVLYISLTNRFVSAWIVSESLNYWTLQVKNNTSNNIFVSYTPEMQSYGKLSTSNPDTYATANLYLDPWEGREVKIKKNFNLNLSTDIFSVLGDSNFGSSLLLYTIVDGKAYATICTGLRVASVDTSGRPRTYHMLSSYFTESYNPYATKEIYKLGLTSSGNYKLQVKNPNNSSLTFRTQTSSLNLISDYGISKWNCKAYAGNDVLQTVSSNSTKLFDVYNNSESYFAIRSSCKGSGNSVYMDITKFSIDKTYNNVTISDNSGVNAFYLRLSIVSKSGSTWTIRVRNASSTSRSFYYNKKMCNFNDAKNLSGLKDVPTTSISVGAYSYKDIQISENWFATSIVVYFKYNNVNYISYADGLSNNSKTLNYYTNSK